jgi:hypothetical protein
MRSTKRVSDGFRGYHYFGEMGTTCDTHVTHSRRPKRPQPTGVGRLGRREHVLWGWVRLAEKMVPFLTETDTAEAVPFTPTEEPALRVTETVTPLTPAEEGPRPNERLPEIREMKSIKLGPDRDSPRLRLLRNYRFNQIQIGVPIATEKKTTIFKMTVVQRRYRKRLFPRTAKLLRRVRQILRDLDSR